MMLFVNLDDVPQVLELTKRERSPGLPAIMLAGLAAGYPLGGSDLKTCTKCLHWVWRGGNYASAFVIAQGSFADQPDLLIAVGEFDRRAQDRTSGLTPLR